MNKGKEKRKNVAGFVADSSSANASDKGSSDSSVPDEEKDLLETSAIPLVLSSKIRAIGQELGEGRHSKVYMGWMMGSGKRVTIKVDTRNPLDEKSYEAIQEKVKTLSKLHHPSIAGILDYVQDFENERTYIIMPYVHGSGLNHLLYDRGPFPPWRVLDWTCQILDALRYLHKNRIIHGEIRPSSIVLTAEAERICLVDFNHASFPVIENRLYVPLDENKEAASDENPVVLHKFQYSEDEDEFRKGVARDIYRTGATMYHLLTGIGVSQTAGVSTLKELESKKEEWNKIGKPLMLKEPDISLLKKYGTPSSVEKVISRATALKPEERYQSAEEMLRDLRNLPRIDKHRTSHARLAVIGGAASLAMLLLGAFFIFTGLYQTQRTAEMKNLAAEAVAQLQAGNYTTGDSARSLALQAIERGRLDPPVVPEAQTALADIISAYDYIAGYKPARSISLAGNPIQAHFSADGTWIAVLLRDAAEVQNNNRRIYVYETDTGNPACPPFRARPDSNFAFTNDDKLFYINLDSAVLYSLTEKKEILKLPIDGIGPAFVTVSEDGKKAAVLIRDNNEVYVYDTDTAQRWSFSLRADSENRDAQTGNRSAQPLFALNQDGTILAASLPDGSMKLYQLSGGAVEHEVTLREATPDDARFLRFEGGFFGDEFFFSAAMTDGTQYFYGGVYHLQDFDWSVSPEAPDVILNAYEEIHVQADENGIYASVGGSLQYYDMDMQGWKELVLEDAVIKLLRHGGGRLLALTEAGGLVLVYREDGSWRTETARGTLYSLAGISKESLFLIQKDRSMLSLLKWREPKEEDTLFTNAPRNEKGFTDPSAYYEHQGAVVRPDKQMVVLYALTGFRVYSLSKGTFKEYDFPDADNVTAVYYLRNPQVSRGEPAEECLQVLHYDGSSFYYSPQDCRELASRTVHADDANRAAVSFKAGQYRVEQTSGGAIQFFRNGVQVSGPQTGTLLGATQTNKTLIVNLRNSDGCYESLFLDKNMNVTAHLPQPCEALPDGTLVFDDRQGHLLRGSLLSPEDLRGRAEEMGE